MIGKVVGPNLDLAVEEKARMRRKNKAGRYHIIERQQKTTFDQVLELYKKEGGAKDYVLQFESTYLSYFGGQKLASITQADLFAFKEKVKGTPRQFGGTQVTDATVNRALAGLRRVFNYAVLRQYMEESPFPKVPKSGLLYPEKKGLRLFFKEEQMIGILQSSPDWFMPRILANYLTGLRQGELLGLRREWVDLKEGIIYLPSTKTLKDPTGMGQKIAMQKELIDLFKSLPKRSEYVFSQPDGKPYRQWHVYKAFKRVLEAVGIDPKQYSWKELRHTTGSLMHLKGAPVLAIKDQLRHTTTLSGGEQQMLAIGRALMAKPKLFLMDEPSLGLAPSIVQELSSITKSINESGISILLVEQNISLAFRVASKGYVMELGNIILQGEMEKLRTNEMIQRAYFGDGFSSSSSITETNGG